MRDEERQLLCERIAEIRLDSCDLDDLESFFYDTQMEHLLESSEEELLDYARDLALDLDVSVN